MRGKDLNQNDLQNILYWYEKSCNDEKHERIDEHNTLIKIQAMLIYHMEEEENFRRRFQR